MFGHRYAFTASPWSPPYNEAGCHRCDRFTHLLGLAVILAAESGTPFPMRKGGILLDYILTLMGIDENERFNYSGLELLCTQALAINACTTLVSVEPKLTIETHNYVMKAMLCFFALPNEPSDVVDPLIDNLITLLRAILSTWYESLLLYL